MAHYFRAIHILKLLLLFVHAVHVRANLQEISIPALGRPFALGDLYDRRRDYIIQGPKLWNHDELSNYVETSSPSTKFDIKASQSINDDMSDFGISASLQMSFMAGLVSVSGSASYLHNRKSRDNQARVSLNYQSTSFTRRLRSELFAKVTFPDVLKNAADATDVIVAIQYGAGAIFSFDKRVNQNEVTKDIEGTLKVIVKKIPKFTVDGSGKVHIGEEDRKKGENLSCTFHGDFVLKTHPGTYEEAIRVYKTLPSLLGESYENSVPVRVWLYPIEKLPIQRSTQVVHEIKESMITSVTNVVGDLESVIRKCNDILDSSVSMHHQRIRVKVTRLHNYVKRYMLLFKQHLATITPEIRKGEMSSNELVKMLSEKEASPFSKRRLEEWISYYAEEVAVLSKIQSLPNYCKNSGEFSSKLLKEVRHTVGLKLKLGTMNEDYLMTLEKYLLDKQIETPAFLYTMPPKWWQPGSPVLSDLFSLSKSFKSFYDLRKSRNNLENAGIQFLVREENLLSGDSKGISIELFEQGTLTDKSYELVSTPSVPKPKSKTHESIHLVWDEPEKGKTNLKGYKVITYSVKMENDTRECIGMYCKVSEMVTTSNNLEVGGLQSQFPYYFTVSAYTKLGETSISEMSDEIGTTKCSPGTYQVTQHRCQKCDPGKYTDTFGARFCTSCPPGTYNPHYEAKSIKECIKCPAGTYNNKGRSYDIKDCLPCNPGTFSAEIGAKSAETCKKCPIGTYSERHGAIGCIKCKTNSYNPDEGLYDCLPCPIGKESQSPGATSLVQCLPLDPAAVVDRKLDAVNENVDGSFKTLKGQAHSIAEHISHVLDDVVKEQNALKVEIRDKGKGLNEKFHAIHGCPWKSGEGITSRPVILVRHGHVTTREACVYNCLKLTKTRPRINGVTRKLSTGECRCIEEMNTSRTAPSSRYQTCVLPK